MRISKLAPSTKVEGRWLCHMEDGTILRVGTNEMADFCLYAGMELEEAAVAALAAATKQSSLRQKAMVLIAGRPLSRKELVDKLLGRDGDEDDRAAAVQTADWLEGLGYLDDAQYAKAVAKHYAAKGYGQGKIRDELWKRGVPRAFWAEAAAPPEETEDGIDAFLQQKLKGEAPDPRTLKRVSDALCRRGYRWGEIKEGLRRYGVERMEE